MSNHNADYEEANLKLLNVLWENKGISLADCEPSIRNIYDIPYNLPRVVQEVRIQQIIEILHEWQNEGIIDVTSIDEPFARSVVELSWDKRSGIFLKLIKRGILFHQTGKVPASKYSYTKIKVPQNINTIDRPLATIIAEKRRRIREPQSLEKAKGIIATAIASRQGQQKFKQDLLHVFGPRCMITGSKLSKLLEAAHIEPYREGGTFNISNGLLLRADIHTLFDLGLVAINTNKMTIIVSQDIKDTEYGSLDGKTMHLPVGREHTLSKNALDLHRKTAGL